MSQMDLTLSAREERKDKRGHRKAETGPIWLLDGEASIPPPQKNPQQAH